MTEESYEYLEEEEIDVDEIIKEWKKQYGYIYICELNDVNFIYRLLSNQEHNDIKNKTETNEEYEEMICQRCVLDPLVDWDDEIYAGFSSSLAIDILEKSFLLSPVDKPLVISDIIDEKYAEVEQSLEMQMPIIINFAFKEYSLKEIEEMPLPQQIDLLAKAKWALEYLYDIPLSFNKE